jgi:hypothetical protein
VHRTTAAAGNWQQIWLQPLAFAVALCTILFTRPGAQLIAQDNRSRR